MPDILLKALKIASGAVIAAAAAYAAGLEYAVSAGIICLLTVRDTRRETLRIAGARIAAFGAVLLLCISIFGLFGFHLVCLGTVIGIFVILCSAFGANEAAAMNCVIATHFFASGDISLKMVINETALVAAGAGTGVLLNLFMPSNTGRIHRIKSETEERLKRIVGRMSVYIKIEGEKSDYTGECFNEARQLLEKLKKEALRYIDNCYAGESDHFLRYVNMRMEQCEVLMRIFTDIKRLDRITVHAEPISELLLKMSGGFGEADGTAGLSEDIKGLFEHYSREALPVSREEFESRALLFHILWDLELFVSLKRDFVLTLSDKEKEMLHTV